MNRIKNHFWRVRNNCNNKIIQPERITTQKKTDFKFSNWIKHMIEADKNNESDGNEYCIIRFSCLKE